MVKSKKSTKKNSSNRQVQRIVSPPRFENYVVFNWISYIVFCLEHQNYGTALTKAIGLKQKAEEYYNKEQELLKKAG